MERFDHYVAVDWAQSNMAIARMTAKSDKIDVIDVPSSLKELQLYLSRLKGKKYLTFEESTSSQWLYTELKSYAGKIIVCDPYRNHLLKEGAKSDKIDASKMVQLLRAGLLKPVFHSGDEFIYLRKLVSGYQDLVKAGVRLKNQRAALFRANGKLPAKEGKLDHPAEQFVLDGIDPSIAAFESEKKRYEAEIARLCRKHKMLRNLMTIPGIAEIGSIKIASRIVDPKRFETKSDFLSYCGLIRLERMSGGRSYGKKSSRYCPMMKDVFKYAAVNATLHHVNTSFKQYYDYLIREKNYPAHNARNAVARRVAILTWGVLKSGKPFEPKPDWGPPEPKKSKSRK
jgi:transposase